VTQNNEAEEKMNNWNSILFGVDGNQQTAHFDDFINLQESPCGFGDTQLDALEDLISQVKP